MLLSSASCSQGNEKDRTVHFILPCELPPIPRTPTIQFVGTDGGVCMSKLSGRLLVGYMQRMLSWIEQASVCLRFMDSGVPTPDT